jgi:phage shock protein C
MEKRLTRIPSEAILGGVAAGLSDYLNIDKSIVRVLWVVALLLPIPPTFFWTAIIYIILWAALPESEASTGSTFHSTSTGPTEPDFSNPEATQPRTSAFSSSSSDPNRSVKIIGFVLLAIGAILLLDELPYWYRIREYIWPVALMGAGAFLLLRQRDKEQHHTTYTSPPPGTPPPPTDPVPPVEPDPVPYRPFDQSAPSTSIDPDPTPPADPDGETDPESGPPQIR